jgi:hypothetical protein
MPEETTPSEELPPDGGDRLDLRRGDSDARESFFRCRDVPQADKEQYFNQLTSGF